MAILWRVKIDGLWHRYCHWGESDKALVSGHPYPTPDPNDKDAMMKAGWTTDGRCWFCPDHSLELFEKDGKRGKR